VFLPACLQANQMADPVAEVRITPAPAQQYQPDAIRGLW
jgi:hypothetical protein